MKIEQLRKIIREEVKAAVKEELQDMLTEAVKIASAPTSNTYKPVAEPKNSNLKWSVPPKTGKTPLDEMLAMTSKEMTNEDFRSVGNFDSSAVKKPNFASSVANQMGINNSNVGVSFDSIPGFDPSKAKAILDAANKKSKERAGV
jgi:hypothetical protein